MIRAIKDHGRVDQTPGQRQQGRAWSQAPLELAADVVELLRAQAVGPADQHQVSGLQLIVKQILNGIEMVEAGVRQALGFQGSRVADHMPGRQSLAVDDGHNGVDAGARPNFRPVEGGHQGLGQGQAAGFNDDAIKAIRLLQQQGHGRQKLVLHGAAETAIGQLHQAPFKLVLWAEATAGNQITVDANLTEFVDQHGQTLTAVQQQMAKKRGLARAQETRHHSDRQAPACFGCHLNRPGPTRSRRRRCRSGQRPEVAGLVRRAWHPGDAAPSGRAAAVLPEQSTGR